MAGKGTRRPWSGRFKLIIRARFIITLEMLVESGARHGTCFCSHPLSIDHTFLKNMVNVTWAPGLNTSCRWAIFPDELRCLDHAGQILHTDHVSTLNSRDSSYHDWLYHSIRPRFSPGVPITPHWGIYGKAGYTDKPRFWLDNCT